MIKMIIRHSKSKSSRNSEAAAVRCSSLLFCACVVVFLYQTRGDDWCSLDTGLTTITDGHGYPHNVYISVTRDGSIWMRSGRDHASLDWVYNDERKVRFESVLLDQTAVQLLESLNYTDYCVLTDINMTMSVDFGWHSSHFSVFYPATKNSSKIVLFKQNHCQQSTYLTLSRDKQSIVCQGGRKNVCKKRSFSETAATTFLKVVNFDPKSQECGEEDELNSYTFNGSYYHAFVKLASCNPPTDSRVWGHEAKLRPYRDEMSNITVIPDCTQTALKDGIIQSWHVFAKIISLRHAVSLQVWRSNSVKEDLYTLIGQTLFSPSELRFQEITLPGPDAIRYRAGDVLGFYVPEDNPIAWSTVPCASHQQRYKFALNPPMNMTVGRTLKFTTAPPGEFACRQYSFSAKLADKLSSKVIEDWICPTARISSGTRRITDRHLIDSTALHSTQPGSGSEESELADSAVEASKTVSDNGARRVRGREATETTPVHLVLMTVGGLLFLMLIVFVVSYYRAVYG